MTGATIAVSGRVAAAPAEVFAHLADLDAHRDLAAPHIEILALDGPRGARTGGLVRLSGPLGVRLTARTRVRAARFPRELTGTASSAGGTTATLAWRLEPDRGHTRLTAELAVDPRTPAHRLLLAAGGRTWLRRRLATAIARIGRVTAG